MNLSKINLYILINLSIISVFILELNIRKYLLITIK